MKTTATLVTLALVLGTAILFSQRRLGPAGSPDRFAGLGDLSGGNAFSAAKSVSADGTVVVGSSHAAAGMQAFRWTNSDGIVALPFSEAADVSADGRVVVGRCSSANHVTPVRWTLGERMHRLRAAEDRTGGCHSVSADGQTIVGVVGAEQTEFGERDAAFRWTPQTGIEPLERKNANDIWSAAHAVSADGSVVVGARRHETGHNEAFRWTAETGAIGLGVLPGHVTSVAYAVSADGSVIVGACSDYLTTEAFRWTKKIGMVSLGTLPGVKHGSQAFDVSADGSVVVGSSAGSNGVEAFIWDAAHRMRSIRQVLVEEFDAGDLLQGWKLQAATAVSANGAVVVGNGVNPEGDHEAWIARLGEKRGIVGPLPMIGRQLTAGYSSRRATR